MSTDDMPDPSAEDAAAMLQRALESWRLERTRALQRRPVRDGLAWLHAAFEGLDLALAAGDAVLARALAGEAIAFALAGLFGAPVAATARLALHDAPGLEASCRPCPAHRWRDALLLACVAAQPAHLAALTRGRPAEVDNAGDAWALVAGQAWLDLLAGRASASARADALRLTAASEAERAWASALDALLAAREPAGPDLDRLPALLLLALRAWRLGRGPAPGGEPYDSLLPTLQGAPVPAVELSAGERVALHAREPGWWFELYGPGGAREHHLSERDGVLLARHEQADPATGLRMAADFVLAASAADRPGGRLALDAGELVALADRRARGVDAEPAADPAARRRQVAALDDAATLVDAAIARLAGPIDAARDFPSVLGRTTYEAEPARFDRERLIALRDRLLQLASPGTAGPPKPDESAARTAALAAIELLRAQLEPLLWAVAHDTSGRMAAALRPRDEDFDKVFAPSAAATARAAYASAWPRAGVPRPADAGQSRLLCHLAPAGMLLGDNELSRPFPGGYRAIAAQLDPHRVWVRWKFCRPGETSGMAYDGLVWVDDHWAWFPKPYRVLGDAAQGGAG